MNDSSGPVRAQLAVFGLGLGLANGGAFTGADSLSVLVLGLAFGLPLIALSPLIYTRAEARLRREVAEGSAALVDGTALGRPAVGRYVRARIRRLPGYVVGAGRVEGRSRLVVLETLEDGRPPRRTAALVPLPIGLSMRRGTPAALVVNAEHPDVAVLDERVTPERLGAIAADPRWSGERLPTDRTISGGYLMMLVSIVGGLLAGVGVMALVP